MKLTLSEILQFLRGFVGYYFPPYLLNYYNQDLTQETCLTVKPPKAIWFNLNSRVILSGNTNIFPVFPISFPTFHQFWFHSFAFSASYHEPPNP